MEAPGGLTEYPRDRLLPSNQLMKRVLQNTKPYSGASRLCARLKLQANLQTPQTRLDNVALYPSQYFDVTNNSYTKYHYTGVEQMGARIGVVKLCGNHLGSASWITDNGGIAIQHLQYLPYGEPFVDKRMSGYNERFTFTGKERDEETGYGYFGARYMDYELTTMWLSVDPMSDKYPSISPYAYCAWNPVKHVDPDGREMNPVYDFDGNFLGNTKEGFTGEPIISTPKALARCMEFYEVSDISELSMEQVLSGFGETFDKMAKRENGLLSEAQEKIFTDIVSKMEGTSVYDQTFSMNDIGGIIKYYNKGKNNPGNIGTDTRNGIIYANHQYDYYETTVENIQSSVVYHEWIGHLIMGWGNGNQMSTAKSGGTHYMCYLSVISSPMFNKTSEKYQKFNLKMFNNFFQ